MFRFSSISLGRNLLEQPSIKLRLVRQAAMGAETLCRGHARALCPGLRTPDLGSRTLDGIFNFKR